MSKKTSLVLAFSRAVKPNDGNFRKALSAITILSEMTCGGALLAIDHWLDKGLITEDERLALHQFYRITP